MSPKHLMASKIVKPNSH